MPTVTVAGIDGQKGSVMDWIDTPHPQGDARVVKSDVKRLAELAVMDYVIGNYDRHGQNFMVDNAGVIQPIDHGLSFPEGNKGSHTIGGHNIPVFVAALAGKSTRTAVYQHTGRSIEKPEELRRNSIGHNDLVFDRVRDMMPVLKADKLPEWADDMAKRHGLSPDSAKTIVARARDVVAAFDKHEAAKDSDAMFTELWKKGWKHVP